jgi:hypothetical protein
MQRHAASPDRVHDALSAFLELHVGAPRSADVGPLFGQAAWLRDFAVPEDTQADRLLHDAFNVALSSDAIREASLRSRAAAAAKTSS